MRRPAPVSVTPSRLALESLPRTDWIWLLHDDSSVLPGTLSGLLDTATVSPDIAVVGPKIREWPSLRRLLEVGLTITATGTRETGLETGEPDAGQHDRERDVLAVNTAGMLIRRDVWDELDGFDPPAEAARRRHRLRLAGRPRRLPYAYGSDRCAVPRRGVQTRHPPALAQRRPALGAAPCSALHAAGQHPDAVASCSSTSGCSSDRCSGSSHC